jgi:hypothetical protein
MIGDLNIDKYLLKSESNLRFLDSSWNEIYLLFGTETVINSRQFFPFGRSLHIQQCCCSNHRRSGEMITRNVHWDTKIVLKFEEEHPPPLINLIMYRRHTHGHTGWSIQTHRWWMQQIDECIDVKCDSFTLAMLNPPLICHLRRQRIRSSLTFLKARHKLVFNIIAPKRSCATTFRRHEHKHNLESTPFCR